MNNSDAEFSFIGKDSDEKKACKAALKSVEDGMKKVKKVMVEINDRHNKHEKTTQAYPDYTKTMNPTDKDRRADYETHFECIWKGDIGEKFRDHLDSTLSYFQFPFEEKDYKECVKDSERINKHLNAMHTDWYKNKYCDNRKY